MHLFTPRNFPGHKEVLRFLRSFAEDSGADRIVRFRHEVVRWGGRRRLAWMCFEAVVVCNSKNTQPKIAEFPGRSTGPGEQLHSHNCQVPEPNIDKIVVIIGNGPSGIDIAKDILHGAKDVHLASRETTKLEIHEDLFKNPPIDYAEVDGRIAFQDGLSIYIDIIIHCTYKYYFPFLKTNGIVNVNDNGVMPLDQYIFPHVLALRVSTVPLKWESEPEPVRLQSRWAAKILSGKLLLPSEDEMTSSIERYYQRIEAVGWPKRHLTCFNWKSLIMRIGLLELGLPPLEKCRLNTYFTSLSLLMTFGEIWRDTWDVEKWMKGEEESDKINCTLEC
ncbi:hypothetical protein ACJRO7_018919 [Eucalyptus globulus]|uniref:Flavin-containing monooxygenase n=1 Tax=Eucalyptus globulus TaxID=34317 RepID=A0ABD3KVG7_EUCGL